MRRMSRRNKSRGNQKLLLFLIPVIVLVMILIVFMIDKVSKSQAVTEVASVSETTLADVESPVTPDNNMYIDDFANYGLQKDALPEINALVEKYQLAKTTGDATLMYEVFGRTDTLGLDEMSQKLSEEMKVYEEYQDTICYTTRGIADGSYVVFISTNVKFAGIDTTAPMLTWAYVVTKSDGTLHMKEASTLTEEERALVDEISASEDVRVLDAQMRKDLAAAIISDAKLAALYQIWADSSKEETATQMTEELEESIEESVAEEETTQESVEDIEIHIEGTRASN